VIPKETIDQIFDLARIEEVVSDFLPLKKRGVNMIGLCPFHNEKTPSFTVSPAKGIFRCFGCGESGNSVGFVMKHENMTYPEALKFLAGKYGIEVKEEEKSSEEMQKQAERESLMAVTAFAMSHFQQRLTQHEEGKAIGLQYFYERGISDHLVEKFQLGYSLESWDDLQQSAVDKGYTKEHLLKVGLLVENDQQRVYDRFRGRVIFPIHNLSGRPIGFGGRILDSSKSKAKYVNSPESEIYHKSDVLYGLHLARTPIVKAENCFLVEGYTDVISMHAAGVENVVASSGTSLTTGQIKLLKRYTKLITILFDGDSAGLKAAFRGIDMIIEEGLNVRVVLFPEGEDPDSYARAHSAEELTEFLEKESRDFILFKSDLLSKEAGDDPVKKANMVKDIVETISLVPENIDRLFFLRQTANIVDIDEQVLINEVNKYRRKKYYKDQKRQEYQPEPTPPKKEPQVLIKDNRKDFEREIIRVLLNFGAMEFEPFLAGMKSLVSGEEGQMWSVASFVVGSLQQDEIDLKTTEATRKLFQEYVDALEQGIVPATPFFVQHEDVEVQNLAIDLLTEVYNLHQWSKVGIEVALETNPKVLSQLVVKAVFSLKLKITNSLIQELMDQLKEEEDALRVVELQNRTQALLMVRNNIAKQMGRTILPDA
jgi:DNA primase